MWWRTSNCSPLLIYRPQENENERLSWLGWLTYMGRITRISGHPSATGRAQDGEKTLARDWRSTAEPCGPIKLCPGLPPAKSGAECVTSHQQPSIRVELTQTWPVFHWFSWFIQIPSKDRTLPCSLLLHIARPRAIQHFWFVFSNLALYKLPWAQPLWFWGGVRTSPKFGRTPSFYIAFWWIECDCVKDCTKLGRPV